MGGAIAAQLLPLPIALVDWLSPHLVAVVGEQNLSFAVSQPNTLPLSLAPRRTALGLTFYGAIVLLLFGTASVLTRSMAMRLASLITLIGGVLSMVALVQRATFTGKIYGFWELVQGGTPFGPFINKNHFAGWMLMAIPVSVGYVVAQASKSTTPRGRGLREVVLWTATPDGNRAVLAAVTALVMSLALVLTQSRSGIVGLILALAVMLTVIYRQQQAHPHRQLIAVSLLVCVFATVVFWAGVDPLLTRFTQINVEAFNQRPAIWADTLRVARDFWLTGSGFNTFGISMLHYQTSVPGEHLREAHSDYLQLAAEGGLWLLLPFTAAVVTFAREVRRRLSEDVGSIHWVRVGAAIGLVAIAWQSAVEFSLQMPGNAALFAVVAGLAIHRSNDGRPFQTI